MSDVNLFEHPTEFSQRDAIHTAIEPAKAGCDFRWTKWVKKFNGLWYPAEPDEAHGIVNPWIEGDIKRDQLFWVLIKPGSVNGMRHHWSHPTLDEEIKKPTKEESLAWLENYCNTHDCPSLDDVLEAINGHPDYRIDGEYFHCDGRDAHGFIDPEFWIHIENYTGFKQDDQPSSWSCSC